MNHSQARAATLIEALPYLQKFSGKTIVIKYGGNAMVDEKLKVSFATDISLLKQVGINPVIVHGGGPQIGKMLDKLGLGTQFIHGMRVTDQQTMDVVEMVLAGMVNKEIVAGINRSGGKAVGLSGKDGSLICADKMLVEKKTPELDVPEIIDVGHVGKVRKINTRILEVLEADKFIPVIAPVGYDLKNGQSYNINADLVASAVAQALGACKLILLTDVVGVLDEDKKLRSRFSDELAEEWIEKDIIQGGMIPKVRCCVDAIRHDVASAHIIDGRMPHAVLLEILTDNGIGTVFRKEA
ncbi:MAG: acetylglutamate kinase [Mariprofundaceae bacterium]|nr:acetylglutamate kinase [Mariprofundaceae bacterium]